MVTGKTKYNWPIVFGELDSGVPWRDVGRKYSIPERVMYEKMRLRGKRLAKEFRTVALPDKVVPAPLPQRKASGPKPQNYAIMVTDSPPPADLTNDQLVTLLADPEAVLQLKPEELEKLAGRRFQMALAAAMVELPEARTLKDVATLHKLFRDANGLSGDQGKGGNGLLSPPRAFGRKMVTMDAVEVRPPASRLASLEDEIREPEGGWPEGMG